MPDDRTPIAYVSRDRQIYVLGPDGDARVQTTAQDPALVWGSWSAPQGDTSNHSWPTWSPDGKQLACFRITDRGSASVLVLDVNGIESSELVDLDGRLPIYLQWRHDGRYLAVLSQQLEHEDGDRLCLSVGAPERIGHEYRLAEGTPLFFTWAHDDVAAFVGSHDAAANRMALLDARGVRPTHILPNLPQNFCAPVYVGGSVYYVAVHEGRTALVCAIPGEATAKVLDQVEGLVALVASPDGTRIAYAQAPRGDGTAYEGVRVLDTKTGQIERLHDQPCLAFLWAGDHALVHASVDTSRNLLVWSHTAMGSTPEPFTEAYPTRDLSFYLRFFEQYSQSHPLVSHDGRHLLLAGGLTAEQNAQRDARLWRVPVDGSKPEMLAEALFGVYAPLGS